MHRALALLLIPALMATFGVASMLHTHAYYEHDHPEHHHGLAVHVHDAAPDGPDDGLPHLKGCDPGEHAISLAYIWAAPPRVHDDEAELILPTSPSPGLQNERTIRHSDVRVHGPPPRTHASPRAPPLIAPA